MMSTVVVTVICLVAVLVALYRLVKLQPATREANYLSASMLCYGLGKLARTPVVTDDWIDGWVHSWSGVWNVTDFSGMALAATGAIFLLYAVTSIFGRPLPGWLLPGSIGVAVAGMAVAFALSPVPDAPTAYMSRDFDMTGWLALYWLIYLACLGNASATVAVLSGRASAVFQPGVPRAAMRAVSSAGSFGTLYVVHKVVNLLAEHFDVWQWYSGVAPQISLVTLACAILSGAVALLLMLSPVVGRRIGRYRMLRDRVQDWRASHVQNPDVALDQALVPTDSRWSLWKASQDPVVAHRMLVELADVKG